MGASEPLFTPANVEALNSHVFSAWLAASGESKTVFMSNVQLAIDHRFGG